jgi:hypothetical protein
VPALAPGAVADVSLAFVAPSVAGHYQATYRLVNSGGGYAANSFWVDIVVRGPAAPPPATYHYAVYHTCANGHCGLNGRAGPGYSGYAVTRVLLDGAAVDIVCQTRGESVSGIDGSSSNVWDKTAQGDFFADFYINTPGMTGSFSPPIPQC